MSSKKKCEVCSENESKYKCPKCMIVYCSLNCYKSHKERCETQTESKPGDGSQIKLEVTAQNSEAPASVLGGQIAPSGSAFNELSNVKSSEPDLKDVVSDFIPEEKLKLLGESTELKGFLTNKHLRTLLTSLDGNDPDEMDRKIEAAMHEPLFQEFSDACLKIVQNKNDLASL